MLNILFPSSITNKDVADGSLKSEYEAAVATGFDVAIFDNGEWFDNDRLILKNEFSEMRKVIYRGFMMPDDKYKIFYEELKKNNIELINDYIEYRFMHIFPKAYEFIKDDTAKILTFPLHEKIDVNEIKKHFKKFMVKDFVKSVKGTDFPKYFDENIDQEEFDKWMEKFYCYRGKLLTGGICIKEYLELKRYDGQVSGLSDNQDYVNYFRTLYHIFN